MNKVHNRVIQALEHLLKATFCGSQGGKNECVRMTSRRNRAQQRATWKGQTIFVKVIQR